MPIKFSNELPNLKLYFMFELPKYKLVLKISIISIKFVVKSTQSTTNLTITLTKIK